MTKLCVFAGTTEGRKLLELLSGQQLELWACVATDYGESLLTPAETLHIHGGRMDQGEMEALFRREGFACVIDATHPYAQAVTENIAAACAATKTEYLRLLRPEKQHTDGMVLVSSAEEAAAYLSGTEGNILLTTGSKELSRFSALSSRAYARVLPMEASLQSCREAGFEPSHIIAMQGPFSTEMNLALLNMCHARYLVTKEGGSSGGFEEKAEAARQAGVTLVLIGRPKQEDGLDFSALVKRLSRQFGLNFRPQVTVLGIGPGSREAMTGEVCAALEQADCVIGAKRMLAAVLRPGQAGFEAILPEKIAGFIQENPQYRRVAVAMSGDTGFFSGTKKLLPLLKGCETKVLPGLSSLSCLCARLGESYEDVHILSLHGREQDPAAELRRHRRTFVLVGGENGMGRLCAQLTESGLGQLKVSVGEQLGYPDESITVGTAQSLSHRDFHSLSVALVENTQANPVVTHGLPDELFQRGGEAHKPVPMTKRELRSVALSQLQLTQDAVCWDIGAGTGSVSIEMALQASAGQVWAIEKRTDAMELLTENRRRFGLANLHLVEGSAPEACRELPAPTHAFIGGSSGNLREIIALLLEKNPAVRIVATAVTLESIGELNACCKEFAFEERETLSLTAARSRKAGPYHLMLGQNPVYVFTMQKK